LFNPPRRKL